MLEKVLNSINTRLTYIESNSQNAYILKTCGIIRIKVEDIKNRKYTTQKVLNNVCDQIVRSDIGKMKRVAGETKMVYNKMNELAGFIEEVKSVYFNENA